ncbi:MAG: Uma2 family endonuclease [Planctomycetota bacterium]
MSDENIFYAPWPVKLPEASPPEPEPVWELAMLQPRQGHWTIERYLELTDGENWPIEFSRGRLDFLPMPTRAHQLIVGFLYRLLFDFVQAGQLGEVFPGGVRVTPSEGDFRIPDLLYLAQSDQAKLGGDRFFQGASLMMEVVSPDHKSRKRDYEEKRRDYAAGGVQEYWIVDPQDAQITVLTLPAGAHEYAEHGVFTPGEAATSKLLDGFAVDVKACFDAAEA